MSLSRKLLTTLTVIATILLVSRSALGQEHTLKKTKDTAIVDGIVQPHEYSFTYDLDKIKLYLNWTQGKLSAAIIVDTDGWVGIGFNSQKMNEADILIGFVRGDNTSFKEQVGAGHRHKDNKLSYLKSFSLKESGGKTTLEVELLDKGVIKPGQKTLPIIVAFGDADSFSSYHRMKKSLDIAVAN